MPTYELGLSWIFGEVATYYFVIWRGYQARHVCTYVYVRHLLCVHEGKIFPHFMKLLKSHIFCTSFLACLATLLLRSSNYGVYPCHCHEMSFAGLYIRLYIDIALQDCEMCKSAFGGWRHYHIRLLAIVNRTDISVMPHRYLGKWLENLSCNLYRVCP